MLSKKRLGPFGLIWLAMKVLFTQPVLIVLMTFGFDVTTEAIGFAIGGGIGGRLGVFFHYLLSTVGLFVGIYATNVVVVQERRAEFAETFEAAWLSWAASLYARALCVVELVRLAFPRLYPAAPYPGYWSFVEQAVVVERAEGREALESSKRVVVGRWWPVLLTWLATQLLFAGAWLLASVMLDVAIGEVPEVGWSPRRLLEEFVGSSLLCLSPITTTVQFLNLRATAPSAPPAHRPSSG